MPCPHLEFSDDAGGVSVERERPYCGAASRFVQPLRADICSERYGLEPDEHCEIFREHEGLEG